MEVEKRWILSRQTKKALLPCHSLPPRSAVVPHLLIPQGSLLVVRKPPNTHRCAQGKFHFSRAGLPS